jgi:hypothetical protein
MRDDGGVGSGRDERGRPSDLNREHPTLTRQTKARRPTRFASDKRLFVT